MTVESYIKALAQRFRQTGMPITPSGSPEERPIGGRIFLKQSFLVRAAMGTQYASQFVTLDKGYLLMFSLAGPDLPSLLEVEKSLDSIHFLGGSN
jgi:hypothetical protein